MEATCTRTVSAITPTSFDWGPELRLSPERRANLICCCSNRESQFGLETLKAKPNAFVADLARRGHLVRKQK